MDKHQIAQFYTLLNLEAFEKLFSIGCRQRSIPCAFTAFAAAARYAPHATYQRATAYVHHESAEVQELLDQPLLQLAPVETGANVILLSPDDDGVFYGARQQPDISLASPIQTYLDLQHAVVAPAKPPKFCGKKRSRPTGEHTRSVSAAPDCGGPRQALLELAFLLEDELEKSSSSAGLACALLFPQETDPHEGTIDVDVALDPVALADYVYEGDTLEERLIAGLYQLEPGKSYRWIRTILTDDDYTSVKVDLLSGEYDDSRKYKEAREVQGLHASVLRGIDLAFLVRAGSRWQAHCRMAQTMRPKSKSAPRPACWQ